MVKIDDSPVAGRKARIVREEFIQFARFPKPEERWSYVLSTQHAFHSQEVYFFVITIFYRLLIVVFCHKGKFAGALYHYVKQKMYLEVADWADVRFWYHAKLMVGQATQTLVIDA